MAQQIVDAIGGYAVRGERLLAAGRDRDLVVNAAAMRGWQALGEEDLRQQAPAGETQSATRQRGGAAEMHDRASEVDAVVLFAPLAPPLDPVGELQRMWTSLDREGVVALAAPLGASGFGPSGVDPPGGSYAFTPLTLSVALDRAGFRMVEYLRLPVGGGLRARLETVAKGSSAGPGQLVSVGVALGRRAATSLGGGPTGGRAVGGRAADQRSLRRSSELGRAALSAARYDGQALRSPEDAREEVSLSGLPRGRVANLASLPRPSFPASLLARAPQRNPGVTTPRVP